MCGGTYGSFARLTLTHALEECSVSVCGSATSRRREGHDARGEETVGGGVGGRSCPGESGLCWRGWGRTVEDCCCRVRKRVRTNSPGLASGTIPLAIDLPSYVEPAGEGATPPITRADPLGQSLGIVLSVGLVLRNVYPLLQLYEAHRRPLAAAAGGGGRGGLPVCASASKPRLARMGAHTRSAASQVSPVSAS